MENLFASRVDKPRKYLASVTRPILLMSMLLVSMLVFPSSIKATPAAWNGCQIRHTRRQYGHEYRRKHCSRRSWSVARDGGGWISARDRDRDDLHWSWSRPCRQARRTPSPRIMMLLIQ